nr:hypothetical protein [Candidatus Sigynarchaeota archaeon]
MTELASDNFLRILLEVCQKTVTNAMIQNGRINDLWKRHMQPFNVDFHQIRQYTFNKNEFIDSIPIRIYVLDNCENIMVDTYWAIKTVAIALFQSVPLQLPSQIPLFSADVDIEKFKLKLSEKFVNSLMAFFAIEKEILTPDLFIYGKISTTIRVKKAMRLDEIAAMITKDGVELTPYVIHGVMQRFKELGLVDIDPNDPSLYKHAKKLELPAEQDRAIQAQFIPIVEWAIETWRTLFNVRELNTPIPDTYAKKEVLAHVVSYAATQGFTNAHFCISEIKRYFQALQMGR